MPKDDSPHPPSTTKPTRANPAMNGLAASDALYKDALEKFGTTRDLLQADFIPLLAGESNVQSLMKLLQPLINDHRVQLLSDLKSTEVIFRLRDSSVATKLNLLNANEHAIYTVIADTGPDGIWTVPLKKRTELHQTNLNKGLKVLEGLKLIQQSTNFYQKGRKIYTLANTKTFKSRPGEAWYTDGDVDIELVNTVSDVVVSWIKRQSWVRGPKAPPPFQSQSSSTTTSDHAAKTTTSSPSAPRKRKRDAPPPLAPLALDLSLDTASTIATERGRELIPHPPDFTDYPTPSTTLKFLESTGLIKSKEISVADMQHLLEMLVFAGRLAHVDPTGANPQIEKRRRLRAARRNRKAAKKARKAKERLRRKRKHAPPAATTSTHDPIDLAGLSSDSDDEDENERMYISVRVPDSEARDGAAQNGLAQLPCGACPAARLCEVTGPVNPRECGHLGTWLEV